MIKTHSSWTQKHVLRNIVSQLEQVSSSNGFVFGCHWGQGNGPDVFTFCKWVILITNSHSFTVNHCGQMLRNSHVILDGLLILQIPPPPSLPSFKIQLKHFLLLIEIFMHSDPCDRSQLFLVFCIFVSCIFIILFSYNTISVPTIIWVEILC